MGFILSIPAHAEEIYRFERMWPTLQQPWYFYIPRAVAVDRNGYIFVADQYNERIKKFTSDGHFVTQWGSDGTGDGQFIWPNGIAVDGDGNVYVADTYGYRPPHTVYNHRIQKFSPDGRFLTKWGSYGSGDGQFMFDDDSPAGIELAGIVVDGRGYVYVADQNNHRIQKFKPVADGSGGFNYVFDAKWGIQGTGDGQFNHPDGIAMDTGGYIYVADQNNHRIQKFTSDGQFVTKWGSYGTGNGQFNRPEGIAVDGNGYVYVTDYNNYRIQKFTYDGQFVTKWDSSSTIAGQFAYPTGITVDGNGYVYTGVAGNWIQKFTSDGQFVTKWGSQGSGDGQFSHPEGIAVDSSSGQVYVAEQSNFRIQKFTPEGQFVTKWGGQGSGDGQFNDLWCIAVDGSTGHVYVADKTANRIQKFTSDGVFVRKWGGPGSGDGQFNWPYAITVDSSTGHVYVADQNNRRIQKFTSDGVFIRQWGGYGYDDGKFIEPRGITVDANGNLYVVDPTSEMDRIQKFTSDGVFVKKWGSHGSGDGQFWNPRGLAVDASGFVYVSEHGNGRIQKFTPDGVFVTKWGMTGNGLGQFTQPQALGISPAGFVYVADTLNHRIQVFRKVTTGSKNKAIIVAGGGPYDGNDLWDATQMTANFAYRTLTYQGFTKENIHYLTSANIDLDNNGVLDDIAGDATNANLQNAILTWASGAEDVIVYLVDHGGSGSFRMSGSQTLLASDLKTWLDTLQNRITGKVIVIYDACESGSFVTALTPPTGKTRITIASTSPGESAYFVTQGSVSFSSYFWTHIFNGVNIKDAFELTRDAIKYTTTYQHPLLDANGNGTVNEAEDLTLVKDTYIGNGTVIQGSAPVIGTVSPDQTITNTSSASLYVDGVTDADGIARVWAVIRPPDYNQGGSDNPVQGLPSIDLMPAGGNHQYEAAYNAFNTPGTYVIAIYASDRAGNTSIPKVTTVNVDNPLRRKAIIVAGGSQTDSLWPAVEKNAGLAYDALRFQGYVDEDIYFMSPVTFSSEVDGTPTLGNLQYALTTWGAANTQDLVLYLVGKGGNRTFQISVSETLNATDLKQWLDILQNAISGKVTVIYDAPQSGSFLSALPPLPGKQRIVISSAGSAQTANFLSSGDISFSKYFWSCVLNGMNVRDAYLQGKRAMSFLSGSQTAYLDDNGNGVGNEKADGQQALNYALGFGITLGADDPLIGSVSPSQTLTGTPSALIWAKDVTTTGTIAKVWAVITPPGAGPNPNVPVMDLPTIDLIYNASANRYEGTYSRFNTQGEYTIVIYAKDDEGNISLPSSTAITQTTTLDPYEDDNSPAHASVIVLNDTAPQTHNFHAQGDEDWVKFYALKDVVYEIKASNLGPNADVVLRLYDGDGTTRILGTPDEGCPPENQQCLGDEGSTGESEVIPWTAQKTGIYYVRVKNYDPTVYGTGTNYDLKVYRPTAPDIGTIRGIIISDRDLSRIAGATIQAGLGSALSEDGSFILKAEAGTVNLSVNIEGYNSRIVQDVVVQAGQETPVTVRMVTPEPGDVDGSGKVDIKDAILALRVISKLPLSPSASISMEADVNGDGKIGMEEVIYILQKIASVR